MKGSVQFSGLKELRASLAHIESYTRTVIMDEAELAAAEVIKAAIQQHTPIKEGVLRDSVEIGKYDQRGQLSVGADTPSYRIGPNRKKGFYGYFLEYGWFAMGRLGRKERAASGSTHSQKGSTGGTHVPAQPFVRPAFDSAQDSALKAATDVVVRKLKELGAR